MLESEGFISIEKITALLRPGEELGIGVDNGIGKAYGVSSDGSARPLDLSGLNDDQD